MNPERYCFVNGELLPMATATIGISDLALLRGYGVFDFLAVRQGVPLFLDDYLARFARSAAGLGLALPFATDLLYDMVNSLVQLNGMKDAGIRLVLTGGYAEDGYTPAAPNLLILEHDLPPRSESAWNQGIHMISYAHQRELPEIKSINYLTGILLLEQLKTAGASEVLFHENGWVRESARSNFFIVDTTGRLVTPGEKILHGITRQRILASAGHLVEMEVRDIALEEVYTAREAFITSTTKGNLPVVKIDNHVIGNGRPGPVSSAISSFLEEQIATYLSQAALSKV